MKIIMHNCYSFVFLSDLSVWFGQLDYLSCIGEVLCDGFDLAVINPNDRKGHDMYFYHCH